MSLTPRERQVSALVGIGWRNQDIAKVLRISERTVRHHVSRVFVKLGITKRIELIVMEQGTQPPSRS